MGHEEPAFALRRCPHLWVAPPSEALSKRGVDIDKGLWEWRYQVETGGPDSARTDCTLELCDYDGSPIATYTISINDRPS